MPASGHSDARLLRTDERRLIRRANPAHDHGSRQPGARPAFAPSSAREGRSAFAAARRTRGGRGHGVRLYRLCAVAALADAATRCPGAADHGRGGRFQPAAGCHSGAGAAPAGRAGARRSCFSMAFARAARSERKAAGARHDAGAVARRRARVHDHRRRRRHACPGRPRADHLSGRNRPLPSTYVQETRIESNSLRKPVFTRPPPSTIIHAPSMDTEMETRSGDMPRVIGKLSARTVATAKPKAGRRALVLADGGNLYLQVTRGKDGGINRSWTFRYQIDGERGDMGLGPTYTLGIAQARAKAKALREQLLDDVDPLEAKEAARRAKLAEAAKTVTFERCAEMYINLHQAGWGARHLHQWRSSLAAYVYPKIGKLSVADVDQAVIMQIIEPLWAEKVVTAARVRRRIQAILDYAIAHRFREGGDNPARITSALPK